VILAEGLCLDDRPFNEAANPVERQVAPRELFGDQGERSATGGADAEGQVTGVAPHGGNDIPAARGTGIFNEITDKMATYLDRGLKAERGDMVGKRQIVVNGLRHMGDLDGATGVCRGLERAEGRVIAANGDKLFDPQAAQGLHDVSHAGSPLRGVQSRRAQD